MNYEIIDFHTHPFTIPENNICWHKDYCNMSTENTVTYLKSIGFSKICGSVICQNTPTNAPYENEWEMILHSNQCALELKEIYGDFYIPGFHVHPKYIQESCDEIEKMHGLGFRLIGELVPYIHGWHDYSCKAFDELLAVAQSYDMVVSFHNTTTAEDEIDLMVKKHPHTILVGAHPGEASFHRHLQRMKWSENYYLDLSGSGLFRHGMLRHGIDEHGAERFLFGSDYPICNPAMFLGGVLLDPLITEQEKKFILSENAKRLLKLS